MMHFCSSFSKRYMTQNPCDSSAKRKTMGYGAYDEESYENIMLLSILCFRTMRAAINRTVVGLLTSCLYYILSAGSFQQDMAQEMALTTDGHPLALALTVEAAMRENGLSAEDKPPKIKPILQKYCQANFRQTVFDHSLRLTAERLVLNTSLSVTAFFTRFLQHISPFAIHSSNY